MRQPSPQGQVAQLVEQRTENPRVGGSSPSLATILSDSVRPARKPLAPLPILLAPQTKSATCATLICVFIALNKSYTIEKT